MGQVIFNIETAHSGVTKFISNDITILAGEYSAGNGKHQFHDPQDAIAHFSCGGEKYIVENKDLHTTAEDWYTKELLPKYQMLILLTTADNF